MPSCLIKGCTSNTRSKLSFYRLPDYIIYPNICAKWLHHAKLSSKEDFNKHKQDEPRLKGKAIPNWYNKFKACEKHFHVDCIHINPMVKMLEGKERRTLLPESLPTLFLLEDRNFNNCTSIAKKNSQHQIQLAIPASMSIPSTIEAKEKPALRQIDSVRECSTSEPLQDSFETHERKVLKQVPVNCENEIKFKSIGVQVDIAIEGQQKLNIHCPTCGINSAVSQLPSIVSKDHSYPVCFADPYTRSPPAFHSTPNVAKVKASDRPFHGLSPVNCGIDNACSSFLTCSTTPKRFEESVSFYEPSNLDESEEMSDTDLDVSGKLINLPEREQIVKQQKYMVFESCLDELIRYSFCREKLCNSPIDLSTVSKSQAQGTHLTISFNCIIGHENKWRSQPMVRKMPAGNLLLAAAILLTGGNFHRVNTLFQFIGLKCISKTTYYDIQHDLVIPEINQAWETEQNSVFMDLKEKNVIKVSCDGRCDSPGHSAKFCTCTLMDQDTNKVVCFSLIQKSEVDFKSTNMELQGVIRCLKQLSDEGIQLSQITTDRHIQIRYYLKTNCPDIDHQFDVWHLAKSVRKKVLALSKIKKNEELQPWVTCIVKHLWYCSENCQGEKEKLIEMWKSLIYHITNVHDFPNMVHFPNCLHPALTPEQDERKKWIEVNSNAHAAITKLVTNTRFINDLKQTNKYSHTSALESFNSLINKYCSKQKDYTFDVMEARTQLAALDHNFNAERKALIELNAETDEKSRREEFEFFYSKATGEWHARVLKEPKSYTYIFQILSNIVQRQFEGNRKQRVRPTNRTNIAPIQRPEKEVLIEAAKKRRLF